MKKKKNEDEEFLDYIYRNAQMGIIGIDNIIDKVGSEDFSNTLKKQLKNYDNICNEALKIFNKYGKTENDISEIQKTSINIMSKMLLIKDDSENSIAKMMIEGTNKGIIKIIERIKDYNESDAEIVLLATKLKDLLEHNNEELKQYL